jgi:DNA polymerase alpha subunit A
MADLLGEVDVNITRPRPPQRMKPVKDEHRRKTRVLSPPISGSKSVRIKEEPQTENIPIDDEPAYYPQDDDVIMSDPLPSSPVGNAVERKNLAAIKAENAEEDDDMEISAVVSHANTAVSVNMTSRRPAPKIKKEISLPTPVSSSPAHHDADAAAWTAVTSKLNIMSSPVAPQITTTAGKLKPEVALEEDGSLNMFWFDYTEINGSLCLFGKVKDKSTGGYASCFVKIDNIQRKLFFLPRKFKRIHGRDSDEEVTMGEVYEEVDNLMSKMRVGTYKIKPTSRKYAFELPDIPKESDYLEMLYPYEKTAPLSMDLNGSTFSHVFGTNTALFEQFVLGKNIMGPCWLKIKEANYNAVTNASWCKLELRVDKPDGISVLKETDSPLETPPMTLMSLSMRTTYNPKDNKQEILIASARVYENISLSDTTPADQLPSKTFTIMRPIEEMYPAGFKTEAQKHKGTIGLEKNEAALLSKFMAMLGNADPDILMGHKLDDVDISVLLSRLKERKTPGWHRIGRLRRSEWPKSHGKGGGFFLERQLVSGRLLCDLANEFAKPLMAKCQSWDLSEMVDLILHTTRKDIDNDAALKSWALTSAGLMQYLTHCEADTYFIAAIALRIQMLPLSKQLTNLAGNSWSRTLTGTRAERNEYILLHEFTKNGYICPDKIFGKPKAKSDDDENEEGDGKKKDKYKGGLVFEPEKGLYDKFILVMDFNSLYPSIIQEFNICFTTVERSDLGDDDDKVPEVPSEQDLGILPKLLSTLVKRRREVKKLMKDKSATPEQLATWDIRQLALKLTANSMYGCLGYTKSRFYARPLAMLTTYKGREILQSTKELAESMQLRVIYGDTDSVMINTNMDTMQEAFKFGREFKKAVNERYKLLEIDIDNIFRRLLLHAKKKYAALNMIEVDGKYIEKIEVKGLDMRRREYSQLSKETSSKLLSFLLSGEDPETVISSIHEYLRELAISMREFKVPVQKYIIRTVSLQLALFHF